MKKYKIIGIIPLSFIFNDEPHDILLSPESGHLETDGTTVWLVDNEDERFESTTTANVIEVGLERNSLKLIT
jgi:hypothetical protein